MFKDAAFAHEATSEPLDYTTRDYLKVIVFKEAAAANVRALNYDRRLVFKDAAAAHEVMSESIRR